jgi:cytoskeletal protein RodZ
LLFTFTVSQSCYNSLLFIYYYLLLLLLLLTANWFVPGDSGATVTEKNTTSQVIKQSASSMQKNPSSESDRYSASQKKSLHFMEPGDSSSHSQQPATSPYPEPVQPNPVP